MATKTNGRNTSKPNGPSTVRRQVELLGRVWANGRTSMSLAVARHVLTLGFDENDFRRMGELSERNRRGLLSRDESDEMDSYVRVGDLISLLHLSARRALKLPAKAGVRRG